MTSSQAQTIFNTQEDTRTEVTDQKRDIQVDKQEHTSNSSEQVSTTIKTLDEFLLHLWFILVEKKLIKA